MSSIQDVVIRKSLFSPGPGERVRLARTHEIFFTGIRQRIFFGIKQLIMSGREVNLSTVCQVVGEEEREFLLSLVDKPSEVYIPLEDAITMLNRPVLGMDLEDADECEITGYWIPKPVIQEERPA